MSHYIITLNGKSLAFTEDDIPSIKDALENASTHRCSTQRFAHSGLVRVTRSFTPTPSPIDEPVILTDC